MFFPARIENGVVNIPHYTSEEIRKWYYKLCMIIITEN
jgi:hypothetical protein